MQSELLEGGAGLLSGEEAIEPMSDDIVNEISKQLAEVMYEGPTSSGEIPAYISEEQRKRVVIAISILFCSLFTDITAGSSVTTPLAARRRSARCRGRRLLLRSLRASRDHHSRSAAYRS